MSTGPNVGTSAITLYSRSFHLLIKLHFPNFSASPNCLHKTSRPATCGRGKTYSGKISRQLGVLPVAQGKKSAFVRSHTSIISCIDCFADMSSNVPTNPTITIITIRHSMTNPVYTALIMMQSLFGEKERVARKFQNF